MTDATLSLDATASADGSSDTSDTQLDVLQIQLLHAQLYRNEEGRAQSHNGS